MDETRQAWEIASEKYTREYDDLLAYDATGASLWPVEHELLGPILATAPTVVHPQSGNGTDDIALVRAGARAVVGVDYSAVAVHAVRRRAREWGVPCSYVIGSVPELPLKDASFDLAYTGKGALIWMRDLSAWARALFRVVRPGGHLFVYESHPAVPLWTWDEDEARIRPDRGYFERSHVNDTFPGNGAVESQWTLGEIVSTIVSSGFEVRHLAEYAEPFYRYGDVRAVAWNGRLPNAFSLLARRPAH